jgi:hypothetical protein
MCTGPGVHRVHWTIHNRVGILKQNAKSRYSGILGFEVRRNSKIFYFAELF